MTKVPAFYDIPAGTRVVPCRGVDCRRPVYWGKTPAGALIPLKVDVDNGGRHPTPLEAGRGISHYLDCPNANDFHRGRKAGRK